MSTASAAFASAFDSVMYPFLFHSDNTVLPCCLTCPPGTIPSQLSDQSLNWGAFTEGLPFTHSQSQADTASPWDSLTWSHQQIELGNRTGARTPTTVDSHLARFFDQPNPVEDAAKDLLDLDTFAFLEGLRVASGSTAGMPVEPWVFPLPSFLCGLSTGLQLRGSNLVATPSLLTRQVAADSTTWTAPVLAVSDTNTSNITSLQEDHSSNSSPPARGVAFDSLIKIPTLPEGWPTATTPSFALSPGSPVQSTSLSLAIAADPLLPSLPSSLSLCAPTEPNSEMLRPSPDTIPSSPHPSNTQSSASPLPGRSLPPAGAEPDFILKSLIVLVLQHGGRVLPSAHIRAAIRKLDKENSWGWVQSQTRTSGNGWETTVQETLAKNPALFVKVAKCHRSANHDPDLCHGACNPLPSGEKHHPVSKGQGWVLVPRTVHTAHFWNFADTYAGWNDIGTWLDERVAMCELKRRPAFMSEREEGTLRKAVQAGRDGEGRTRRARRVDITAPRERERGRRNHVVHK